MISSQGTHTNGQFDHHTAQRTMLSFPSFEFEREIERAEWFKENLDKGGWKEAYKGCGCANWIKTFPSDEVPIKVLFT